MVRVDRIEPRFVDLKIKGPSSVAFHAQRGTILVASDEGYIVELDMDLRKIDRYKVKGDLEGIAVHPTTGQVYLASEREGAILELDLDEGDVTRTIVIDFESHTRLEDVKGDNKGIEGLAFFPTGDAGYQLFSVLQAGPARLLQLSENINDGGKMSKRMRKRVRDRLESSKKRRGTVATVNVDDAIKLKLKSLSDVVFAPSLDALVVISSARKVALLYDPSAGNVLGQFKLPGKKPEGVTFLPDGELLVVDDEGGAWWIENAERWIEENPRP